MFNPMFIWRMPVLRTPAMRSLWLTLPLIALLTACASDPKTPQLSERQFYEEAQEAIDGNNMTLAIDRLQGLESRYPFGRYASQAKLDLIYCHYRSFPRLKP